MGWYDVKTWLEATSGLDMDALHVHAGVLCQLAAALLLRRPLSSVWPWLVVLVAVAANEAYDMQLEVWPNRDDQVLESIKDAWNTLLLPTLLLLVARFAPWLVIGSRSRTDSRPD
jgi:hypothetical protein